MFCGMVPIIVNICKNENDKKWLNWAKGLYFEAQSYDDLLQIMANIRIFEEQYNLERVSKQISQDAQNKFSYNKFQKQFTEVLQKLIGG